ncbi:MAG: hypothetical protein ACHQCF_01650 [Solirubrobacterales bacterium]
MVGRLGLVVTLCACVLAIAGVGAASAAGWQLPGHIEDAGEHTELLGISCPSTSLCVAGGEGEEVASSGNPDRGSSAWRLVHPEISEEDHPPPPPPPGFPVQEPPRTGAPSYRKLHGVSCPSPRLCVAVTFDGYVFSSTDPTGGAGDWHVTDIDGKGP